MVAVTMTLLNGEINARTITQTPNRSAEPSARGSAN